MVHTTLVLVKSETPVYRYIIYAIQGDAPTSLDIQSCDTHVIQS